MIKPSVGARSLPNFFYKKITILFAKCALITILQWQTCTCKTRAKSNFKFQCLVTKIKRLRTCKWEEPISSSKVMATMWFRGPLEPTPFRWSMAGHFNVLPRGFYPEFRGEIDSTKKLLNHEGFSTFPSSTYMGSTNCGPNVCVPYIFLNQYVDFQACLH